MNRAMALAALALLAGACGKTSSRPAAAFKGISAVAVFHGYFDGHPTELRAYAAVASPLGDELKFVDALDGTAVVGPAPVGPLSLPVLPRPSYLAATSLADQDAGGAAAPQADLLVVASASPQPLAGAAPSVVLEVVGTWDPITRVAATVDLGPVAPDATLLALLATPVPRPATGGGFEATPGRARVVAALTGGRLVTVEFARGAGGRVEQAGDPVLQVLGFEPLALAATAAGALIYVASPDPIPGPGGLLGVAELDGAGTPGAFAVRALDARAPTVAVAALDVREFTGFTSDPSLDTFTDTAATRVYAALQPGSCGRDALITCGVAVIDPALGGLAADPAGLQPFQQPIQVPGTVTSLSAVGASLVATEPGLLVISPGTGQRYTSGLLVAGSTTGQAYLLDPSHFAVPSDTDLLRFSARTRVSGFVSSRPVQADGRPYPKEWMNLGVWDERTADLPDPNVFVGTELATAAGVVKVTPGFTNTETWTIIWQDILPGLGGRRAQVHGDGAGLTWVALQDPTGLTGPGGVPVLRDVARLYDPVLSVRVGDLVVVDATRVEACRADPAGTLTPPHAGRGGLFDLRITAILPPTAAAPGGSVAVTPVPDADQPRNPVLDATGNVEFNLDGSIKTTVGDPHCLDGLTGEQAVLASIRSPALLLTGSSSGVVGRPEVVADPPGGVLPFEVTWQDEGALPACPILLEPGQAWPPPAAAISACEADAAACRSNCERVVVNRRVRRLYYLTDRCAPADTDAGKTTEGVNCLARWAHLTFPFPLGPVLSFKIGVVDGEGNQVNGLGGAVPLKLLRDTIIRMDTSSGIVPTSRTPHLGGAASSASLPTQASWFDRAAVTGNANDSVHAFVGFGEGMLLDFGTNQSANNAKTIR